MSNLFITKILLMSILKFLEYFKKYHIQTAIEAIAVINIKMLIKVL